MGKFLMSGFSEGGASLTKKSLKAWLPQSFSSKSDLDANLNLLRSRSKDLILNSPVGRAAINTSCTGAISTGLKLYPRLKTDILKISAEEAREWARKTKNEFELWAGNVNCDFKKKIIFTNFKRLPTNHI